MSNDLHEMIAALEAVLFVSPEPVSKARLLDLFLDEEKGDAEEALAQVIARYSPNGGLGSGPGSSSQGDSRGVILEEVAGGLRLITRPELNEWLRRFFEASSSKKLSIGALETLAIVAYRQPITLPEIQELRGVNPSGVLKTLLERRLVRIAGRKEVVGKPFLYASTQDFLVHFGLRSLKDLPPLEEFEEALAGEGLGELLGGTDFEEEVLLQAAQIEDGEEAQENSPEANSEASPDAEEDLEEELPKELAEELAEEPPEELALEPAEAEALEGAASEEIPEADEAGEESYG